MCKDVLVRVQPLGRRDMNEFIYMVMAFFSQLGGAR